MNFCSILCMSSEIYSWYKRTHRCTSTWTHRLNVKKSIILDIGPGQHINHSKIGRRINVWLKIFPLLLHEAQKILWSGWVILKVSVVFDALLLIFRYKTNTPLLRKVPCYAYLLCISSLTTFDYKEIQRPYRCCRRQCGPRG